MQRTEDVISEAASFRELLLPEHLLGALAQAGFLRPSPVQQAAIPLARLGADVIVQAKAGTGKTLVFALAALERVDLLSGAPQVLVLAPTREIALQASEVIGAVAGGLPPPGLACGTFIGGLPIEEDERFLRRNPCHVAVGTPGRLAALLARGALPASRIRLLVLDEADKLLGGDCFEEDLEAILGCLPERKQTLALSATYSQEMLQRLRGMMKKPREVLLCSEEVSLLGIHQLYLEVAPPTSTQPRPKGEPQWRQLFEARVAALLRILSSVAFHQAMVFCNWRRDAEEVAERLQAAGYPAAYLSAAKGQLERIDALNSLRDFRLRVAVTTDLAARGIDLERVNLVVNLDLPQDSATYMHRVGRAGRFGSRGVSVTLVAGQERAALEGYLREEGGQVHPLPDTIPHDWYAHSQQQEQQQQQEEEPSCDGSGTAANGSHGPMENGPAAAEGGSAAGAAPVENGRLAAAFLDVATASLWFDEPRGDLLPRSSTLTWPPDQPPQPPQPPPPPPQQQQQQGLMAQECASDGAAAPSSTASGAAGSAPAASAAAAVAIEAAASAGGGEEVAPAGGKTLEEDGDIDLSYTVVDTEPRPRSCAAAAAGRPGAAAAAAEAAQAALLRLSAGSPQQQRAGSAGGAPSVQAAWGGPAGPAGPPELAAGAGRAGGVPATGSDSASASECSDSEDDSWASSSDDVLSSSDDPGSPAFVRRAHSLPASIPTPQLQSGRHHHHHHHHHHSPAEQLHHTHHSHRTHQRLLANGTLSAYLQEARRSNSGGLRNTLRASSAPATTAPMALETASGADSAAGAAPGRGSPAREVLSDAAVARQLPEAGDVLEEQDFSFRDAWLSGAVARGRQLRRSAVSAAASKGGPSGQAALASSSIELRPHPPALSSPFQSREAGTGAAAAATGAEAAATHPPAALGGPVEAELRDPIAGCGGSSTALSAGAQAHAEPAAPRAASLSGSSQHYWVLADSVRADLAAGGAAAEGQHGGELGPEAARLLEEAFRPQAVAAAAAGSKGAGRSAEHGAEGAPEPSLSAPAASAAAAQQDESARHQPAAELVGAVGGRQRRPLGSAQADAARQHGQRAQQEGGSQRSSGGGGGRWGSLAEEAAILEAWAEGGDSEDEEEEGGLEGEGEEEGGEGPCEEASNEEAWRQYYLQYYQYYGCYPSYHGSAAGSSQAATPAAPPASSQGESSKSWAEQPSAFPPPPPPPRPPMQPAAPLGSQAAAASGQPAARHAGPWVADSEGYVRVPAEVLARLQEAEWREWQRRYSEWCWVWDRWYGSYWSNWTAQGSSSNA